MTALRVRSLPACLTALVPVLLLAGACRPRVEPLPDPPSILVRAPDRPTPADAQRPGNWVRLATDPATRAFEVAPSGAPVGGVLLVHSQWGINADVRTLARELAARGYVVVAPDVFEGVEATSRAGAMELVAGVGASRGTDLLRRALDGLAARDDLKGRPVSVLGIGPGGVWAARLVASGAPVSGVVLDSAPVFTEQSLPGQWHGPVLFLVGADSSLFVPERRQSVEKMFAGQAFAWAEIPYAGNELLDPGVLGFSPSGYALALERVTEFLGKLPARG